MNERRADLRIEYVPVLDIEPEKKRCLRYGNDTWKALAELAETPTGLPSDRRVFTPDQVLMSPRTSPSNIGIFLESIISARKLGFITPKEEATYIEQTLSQVESMDRYKDHFYNWYETSDASPSHTHPKTSDIKEPFVSAVDEAWLMTGLLAVQHAAPEFSDRAKALVDSCDLSFYYDNDQSLFTGGYFPTSDTYTTHRYSILNSETRMISYLAIGLRQVPPEHLSHLAAWSLRESGGNSPQQNILRSCGGTMFEALRPASCIPEEEWAPGMWGINHGAYIQAQQTFANVYTEGIWGVDPMDNPDDGTYTEYGVKGLGFYPYQESTVVSPDASFLALQCRPQAALDNLYKLEALYPQVYRKGSGFFDSVDIRSGKFSASELTWNKGMSLTPVCNYLTDNVVRGYITASLEQELRPAVARLDQQIVFARTSPYLH